MNRNRMLAALREAERWDVLIIGGGATGLGTALDALSRGYRTALVEAADFANATSSRSTKLIHGGVRYLRSGQLKMVRESLQERGRLLRNAPHLVHARRFIIPSYRIGGRWYFMAGMKAYDYLAGELGLDASQLLSTKDVSQQLPNLRSRGLRGGVAYSDGQFDDARLALALAQTCADKGGIVANYMRVVRLTKSGGKISGAVTRDEETGNEIELSANVVVNATGVFAEDVMRLDQAGPDQPAPTVVPSQGTHIVVDLSFLDSSATLQAGQESPEYRTALLIPKTDDGRVLFAIPWYGKLLIGTTDHRVDEIALEPRPLRTEIDYLLEHAGRYLTRAPGQSDVQSVFAGLRPLVGSTSQSGVEPARSATASLSREHEIYTASTGLITVIGGKWTTYRQMGQDVVDLASRIGGLAQRPTATADLHLTGSQKNPLARDRDNPLSPFQPFSEEIDALEDGDASLAMPIHSRLPYRKSHVVYSTRKEMARTVDDILARRTRMLLLDAQAAIESADAVAQLMAQELGCNLDWQQEQISAFKQLARHYRVAIE